MQKSSILMQLCEQLQNNGRDLMFYERFIQLCEDNNEKPTNVLKSIGVSSGNLNNWKNGASVKSDILMQLSEHFNVSIDYLLGKTENTTIKSSNDTLELVKMIESLSLVDRSKIVVMIDELINKKVS